MQQSRGDLPLSELWTVACQHQSEPGERGCVAPRAYLHAKHALLVVMFEGRDAYVRTEARCGARARTLDYISSR